MDVLFPIILSGVVIYILYRLLMAVYRERPDGDEGGGGGGGGGDDPAPQGGPSGGGWDVPDYFPEEWSPAPEPRVIPKKKKERDGR